jgi:hypothetical protein
MADDPGFLDLTGGAFLGGDGPNPTQSSLDALLAKVARVEVRTVDGQLKEAVADRPSLEALAGALQVFDGPMGHCMCAGDPHLWLFEPGSEQPAATLGVHHGTGLRWDGWGSDAELCDGYALLAWLAEHGAPEALREVEEDAQRGVDHAEQRARWGEACPASLQPRLAHMIGEDSFEGFFLPPPGERPGWLDAAEACLTGELPAVEERVRALLTWYGTVQAWTGFASHEELPLLFLRAYSTQQVVAALAGVELTGPLVDGAARLLAAAPAADREAIPDALAATLVGYAFSAGDPFRVDRVSRLIPGVTDDALRAELAGELEEFEATVAMVREATPGRPRGRRRPLAGPGGRRAPLAPPARLGPRLRRRGAAALRPGLPRRPPPRCGAGGGPGLSAGSRRRGRPGAGLGRCPRREPRRGDGHARRRSGARRGATARLGGRLRRVLGDHGRQPASP